MIIVLFSAGGIVVNLNVALMDQTMAIDMLSGLHVPAVVKQECVVDYRLSAEKQRSFNSSGQAMISHEPDFQFSINSSFHSCSYLFVYEKRKGGLDCVSIT